MPSALEQLDDLQKGALSELDRQVGDKRKVLSGVMREIESFRKQKEALAKEVFKLKDESVALDKAMKKKEAETKEYCARQIKKIKEAQDHMASERARLEEVSAKAQVREQSAQTAEHKYKALLAEVTGVKGRLRKLVEAFVKDAEKSLSPKKE